MRERPHRYLRAVNARRGAALLSVFLIPPGCEGGRAQFGTPTTVQMVDVNLYAVGIEQRERRMNGVIRAWAATGSSSARLVRDLLRPRSAIPERRHGPRQRRRRGDSRLRSERAVPPNGYVCQSGVTSCESGTAVWRCSRRGDAGAVRTFDGSSTPSASTARFRLDNNGLLVIVRPCSSACPPRA
jgi:hypothetical protein